MSIKSNVGKKDKMLRMSGGLVLLALAFSVLGGLSSIPGILATVVGAVLLVTGLVNFCPAYKLLGIDSSRSKSHS